MKKDVTYEDLAKLNYTSCVYKETLRLWPAIPEVARGVDIPDLNVQGYHIPRETWIQVSTYVNARQAKYFPDSDKFMPERFLIEEKSGEYVYPIENYTYFPFSLGPRGCIGQNLAQVILQLVVEIYENMHIRITFSLNYYKYIYSSDFLKYYHIFG